MKSGPWREFLLGVIVPVTVALGVGYQLKLGKHVLSPHLEHEEQQKTSIANEIPPASLQAGTEEASVSSEASSAQRTQEARKRLANTEAAIAARLQELRKIGAHETEMGQFTPPPFDRLSIDQAVKKEEDRARRMAALVTAAKKRQERLRARITAMLRKVQSESLRKQFTPRPEASLQELEELNARLEAVTVHAMRE